MGIARPPIALLAGIALVAAACSAGSDQSDTTIAEERASTVAIVNQGGTSEGHTPTEFPGTGPGLFIGDNLNAAFPDGVGVQTYLEFALPPNTNVVTALLRSDKLMTSGTPFEDLGRLLVEPVVYDTFGPDLYDLPAAGPALACLVFGGTILECDVSSAVQTAVADGRSTVQLRLRFETPADNDGTQDLAMFYQTNSNTNEPGLFELLISP